jgi:hypothetical protein
MTSIQLSLQTINHVVKMWSSTSLRTDVFAATREGKIVDKIRNVQTPIIVFNRKNIGH